MKNVLVFIAGGQGAQEGLQLDEAIEQYNKGNNVTILSCDEYIGCCNDNKNCNKWECKTCKYFQYRFRKKYLPIGIKQETVGKYVDDEIICASNISFPYNDIQSLRKIEYHGVEIGLGAVSSYISYTRNLNPTLDIKTKQYFDSILKSEIILTLVIEKILRDNQYDLFILHNGRFAIFKPMLNIAQREGIEFICTESYKDANDSVSKDYYYNDIPHNIGPRNDKYLSAWDNAVKLGIDREALGASFYEKRRNAEATGDKIYIASQEKGKLIDTWDDSKENIVIFNSSEDEFCAIGGDFEKERLFESQLDGIKTIVEHYSNDKSKHFYLRVHPNLIPIKYAYHLDLYKLKYPNLTVIPANSSVSSYALLDKADKVITFGSTMGVEATYAGKPSICIGASFYERLNVVYQPKTVDQIWKYIDDKNLVGLNKFNTLIYGYYSMAVFNSIIKDKPKYIDNDILSYRILGTTRLTRKFKTILGSNILYLFIKYILRIFSFYNGKR